MNKWIEYKGKKIFFTDYSGIKDQDQLFDVMYDAFKKIEDCQGKILTLTDVTNTATGPEFMEKIKELGEQHSHKFGKTAVLGVTGLKRLMLKGYNTVTKAEVPNKPFQTKEEALEYLVS